MSDCIEHTTLQSWRAQARKISDARHHEDIDWLIQHTLGLNRAALISRSDLPLAEDITRILDHGVSALRDDVPLAYLVGTQPFWTFDLAVTTDTLVPRADTEILVHCALSKLTSTATSAVIADLGTGSGAVALALASEHPDARVHAVDASPAALGVAQLNAQALDIKNVTFFEGDWAEPLPLSHYDLIVSNPPYVETVDGVLPASLRHEPTLALAGGSDGLDEIRRLVPSALSRLCPGGWLLIEHGHMQAEGVSGILHAFGFTALETVPDIAGRDRVSLGRRPTDSEA